MKISNEIRQAMELCLCHSVAFVAYARPSTSRLIFRSSLGSEDCEDCDYFFVNTFASPVGDMIRIPFLADEHLTIEALGDRPTDICGPASPALPAPTDRNRYVEAVEAVIAGLNQRGGKTVISRTICGTVPGIDWTEFARMFFAELPMTYRFIYYTPATGAWIVASPELLLSYDRKSATAHTVALAGTRKAAGQYPWDSKNTREQQIVSEYIENCLRSQGLTPEVSGPFSSRFGEIEHLCSSFDIFGCKLGTNGFFALVDALSPTPALAGYPLSDALDDISRSERHKRGCYGGYIGLVEDGSYVAVVNLRCLQFDGDRYCLYAGGGIMPDSDVTREWKETEAKTALAREIIEKLARK